MPSHLPARSQRVLVLVVCALMLLPLAGSVVAVPLPQRGITVSAPVTMAGGAGNQRSPHMAGGYMVYSTCRPGDCDVWALDLRTNRAFAVAEGPNDEAQPATDGARVVWRDSRNAGSREQDNLENNMDIYGAYLDERKPFPVASGPKMQNRPSIWGSTLVWADFRGAAGSVDQEAGDIYISEFPSNQDTLLVGARSAQTRPVTDGKWVVWADYRNEQDPNGENSDIYAYNLATRQEIALTTAPDQQTSPAIWGNIVVWTDFRKGTESDIYAYDLAARRELPISTAPGSQVEPAIHGNLVVWRDFRNEPNRELGTNSDIYAYDLASKQEVAVFVGPGPQGEPSVWNGRVAWEDAARGLNDTDIAGATVTGVAAVQDPPLPIYVPGGGGARFPQTGKAMMGLFHEYWQRNGGLPQQGYPISDLMRETSDLDGKSYLVQYSERAVFEYHPEQQDPRYKVLLSQLGTFRYRQKYAQNAPGQVPNNTPGSVLFPETGKRVGGRFLEYWQQNGGLPQQGFPISDEFTEVSDLDGKPYLVQYFERAVFEWHPENQPPYDVLLSQLGTFRYKAKYGER